MASTKCTVCGKDQANKCSRCKAAAYCSAKCQKNDFPLHKLLCSKYQDFLKTRPDPTDLDESGDKASAEYEEHAEDDGDENSDEEIKRLPPVSIAALLFPVDADYPRLIWLKCKNWIEYGELTTKFNGTNIELWMEQEFGRSPAHQCLSMLNAGYGTGELDLFFPTRYPTGSIIVVNSLWGITDGRAGELEAGCEHQDVTLSDLRYAFTYLTRHNALFESDKQNTYYIRKPGRWFKAVKLCCDGEMKFEGKKKFTEVAISRHHPVFSQNSGVSGISKHLGFPLLVKRIPPNPNWNAKMTQLPRNEQFGLYENSGAVSLMVDVEVASKRWKYAPKIWDRGEDPTVLVARKDMKDLTTCQVEVLTNYCLDEVSWNMGVIMEREDEVYWVVDEETGEPSIPTDRTRQKFIDDYLLSDKFANYFEEFKQNKISEGDDTWADATLPPKGSVPDKIVETEEERHEAMIRMMGML